jgi:hypothetical protein
MAPALLERKRLLALGDWHLVARGELTMQYAGDFDGHTVHRFNAQDHLIETWHGTGLRFEFGYHHACERGSVSARTAPRVLEI